MKVENSKGCVHVCVKIGDTSIHSPSLILREIVFVHVPDHMLKSQSFVGDSTFSISLSKFARAYSKMSLQMS